MAIQSVERLRSTCESGGARSVPSDPPVDCFYVYPTVRVERRGNADLKLQPEERETAMGLHAADVNIALGTLFSLVGTQAQAWLAKR